MAQIDPPLLPPRLYRYRKVSSLNLVERELDAIANDYLWCCHYKELNDQMEGVYGVSPWLARQPSANRLSSEILNQKRSVGICCFSDTYENELMWVHYAENYSGICVAYSAKRLNAGLGDHVHVVRVAYGGIPPRIGEADVRSPDEAARKILSHKKSSWSYEREWRLLTEGIQVPGKLQIAVRGSVKAVYFGSRVKEEFGTTLIEELSKMNIPIRRMNVSDYTHEFVPL